MQRKRDIFREGPMLRENGYHYLRANRLPQAHRAFDYALWADEANVRTLLGCSQLYQRYLQLNHVMEIVAKGIEHRPNDIQIRHDQAEMEYLNGDFEQGLITNYRWWPYRKQPPYFKFGVFKCKEAINGCVGDRAGHPLRDYSELIKRLEQKKRKQREEDSRTRFKQKPDPKILKARQEKYALKIPETITSQYPIRVIGPSRDKLMAAPTTSRLAIPTTRQMDTQLLPERVGYQGKYKPLQAKTTNIKKVLAEKYLEKLARDKEALLINEKDIANPNQRGVQLIRKEAARGYNTIAMCQKILRTRTPFYAIKFQQLDAIKSLADQNELDLEWTRVLAKREAETFISVLRLARENNNFHLCQDLAERAKICFDKKTQRVLPKKNEYLEIMYNIIGLAYLDSLRIDSDSPDKDEARIKYMLGLPVEDVWLKESYVMSMTPGFKDLKKCISTCKTRITQARSALELAWLYYDLARNLIEHGQYEYGRHYAIQCVLRSDAIGNEVWAINGTFLIIKVNVYLRNRNEAKDTILNGIYRVQRIYYTHSPKLLAFFEKCLDIVEMLDFEDIAFGNAIAEREEAILNLIVDRKQQAEIRVLFKRMHVLPANRRISIMPGVTIKESKKHIPTNHLHDSIAIFERTAIPIKPTKRKGPDAFLDMI